MDRPAPLLDAARVQRTLATLLDRCLPACAWVNYRLVGTAAALLHGVHLPAADIDLLVADRPGVDALAAALQSYKWLEPPAWLPDTRQYYGNVEVEGVEVGLSTVEVEAQADTIETFGPGPWQHFTWLACGSHHVPTVCLELRLITELARDRPDRSQPLLAHLLQHGCDLVFIQRGLQAAGLPLPVQAQVVDALGCAPFKPVPGSAPDQDPGRRLQ